ncbi:hypothetical protein ILUMI_19696 [Ignelater luminosus]|uniref:Uncharacterized protein n=1 Tax=Ignelater luminosus TaxID=2038154 RepID=A0A8K0CLX6_IGNLU|nr:hypothetical protein ILUMI_19696 [Ignelater luminosus]
MVTCDSSNTTTTTTKISDPITEENQSFSNNAYKTVIQKQSQKRTRQEFIENSEVATESRFNFLAVEDMKEEKYITESVTPSEKKMKIPPIIVTEKERWVTLSSELKRLKYNFTKARNINYGININPETIDDYCKTIHLLDMNNIAFYTHQLSEDKLIRMEIRDIPSEIFTVDV